MFELRGVLEGFYGRPWSWAERERMLGWMGSVGFNYFLYAPKNDPLHRNRWREPYLPEELARFARLREIAVQNGVEFAFGLSPLEYHYSSETDLSALLAKLEAARNVGISSFSILLDDMPERFRFDDDAARFPGLAHAQAWLCNTLFDRLSPSRLVFTPTEYHGAGTSPYLRALGRELRAEVDVFWTGREVCSATLETADALSVSGSLRRRVLYWDNYPVNDLEMRFDAHLRPVRGRAHDLDTACKGIVANGALQAEASKVALHTLARYVREPATFDPEAAWQDALGAVAGNTDDARALAVLGGLASRSPLEPRGVQGDLVTTLETAELSPAALPDLEAEFHALEASALHLLERLENRPLRADIRPWAAKLRGWARVGLLALEVLRLGDENPSGTALSIKRNTVLDAILETRENFSWVAGDAFDRFARRCLRAAQGPEEDA